MTRSANEVMSLASKAARGAGAPVGQAADFGRAAVCHLAARREADDLRKALDALPGGPILSLPLVLSSIMADATGACVEGVLPEGDNLALSYAEALPFAHSLSRVQISIDLTRPTTPQVIARVEVPQDLADHMTMLAARTYVPESEASRLSGAGAGLTDND